MNSNMLNFDNYQREKLTINLVWANLSVFIFIIPILLVFALPYYLIWEEQFTPEAITATTQYIAENDFIFHLILLGILILGIILHELIHGVVWAFFAKQKFKSIKFGVLWKILTPYCHCKEPLQVSHYILGGIMPAIVLGIIPSIIALIIGNLSLLILGIFFTVAACGDFLIVYSLRKENKQDYVQDHPIEAGCYIYRKIKR